VTVPQRRKSDLFPPVPAALPEGDDEDRLLHAVEGAATFGLSPVVLSLAALDWAVHLANAPYRRLHLARLWVEQWRRLMAAAAGEPAITPSPGDHRFSAPAWRQFPYDLLHQAFLLTDEWWGRATTRVRGTTPVNERIVAFSARQWLDMMSPSNIPWLNPEVIEATRTSGGRNLVQGFCNFLADLGAGEGSRAAARFAVGRDLAVTPGKVVLRNDLMELIQYAPATSSVHAEPLLIVPAWIMKYYILDLSPENSLVRYLVRQGFTVFCISWRNPGADQSDVTFDDYRRLGIIAALDVIETITGTAKTHVLGYCLGGTLSVIAAAALARDRQDRLASLTLLATQTDFTEAGGLQIFITESQVTFLEDIMWARGTLASTQMAGAFQLLRSNDLVWSRAVRNYLLGVQDQPNDLMAWNADATRMPYRMHAEYLRRLFLDNDLAEGHFPVDGRPVSVDDIAVPMFIVGTETDHVAPWHSVYKLHLLNKGDITFVLTSGGHNAGIVSEPGHPNRHYAIKRRPVRETYIGPDEWLTEARQRDGSWWPAWSEWLAERAGPKVEPPPMGGGRKGSKPLADAPGTYVFEK